MLKVIVLLFVWANLCSSHILPEIDQANVATAPPNCLPTQQLVNGQCRDVWAWDSRNDNKLNIVDISNSKAELDVKNVVTVPPNCPTGQEYINGQCRDVWAIRAKTTVKLVIDSEIDIADEIDIKNVVTVPPNCPSGQVWSNGQCREVWRMVKQNVVSVPDNCPSGQQLIQGQCRDVWAIVAKSIDEIENSAQREELEILQNLITSLFINENRADIKLNDPKNIVNVPSQCPDGYKADANGFCRRIWD